MEWIFNVALFMIPFDNLIFAPSAGWATISPILFFLYDLVHFEDVFEKIKSQLNLVLLIVALQFISFFRFGINTYAAIDAISTMVLGVGILFAFLIKYDRLDDAKREKIVNILLFSYCLSYCYGLVKLTPITDFLQLFEKRIYDRVSFSFTEPSFISMHMFGMLLIATYFTKDSKKQKTIVVLSFLFIITALLFRSSTRIYIDIVMFTILFLIKYIFFYPKHRKIYISISLVIMLFFPILYYSEPRISRILTYGIYSDGSLATRWFRINALLIGLMKDPISLLFGCGVGNMYIPFNLGYIRARSEYVSSYITEVDSLKNVLDLDSVYNLPGKLIAEFGLLLLLYFFYKFLKNTKKIDFFVIVMSFWLYMQFDSYAFYTIWIILFIGISNVSDLGKSYFDVIDNMIVGSINSVCLFLDRIKQHKRTR